MKLPLLFCGYLFVALGEHSVLARYSNWQQNLSADLEHMQQQMMSQAQQIQQEAAAQQKYMQANAQKMQKQAEAERNRFDAQLQVIKQKCAQKGSKNDTAATSKHGQRSGSVSQVVQVVNGIQHIYEQIIDTATNMVHGKYYSFDPKNPNAEPNCGQLTFY